MSQGKGLSDWSAAELRELVEAATAVLQHKDAECGQAGVKRARSEEPASPDDLIKAAEMRASETAGDCTIPFGKHRGIPIRSVDLSYLVWMLGFKRSGQKFSRIARGQTGNDWVRDNHPTVLSEVQKYMTWRCWACRSTGTRFRFACLCRSCWTPPT